MASVPIAYLRDDFTDNLIAAAWTTIVSGSATASETGGQAVLALPSSTAGSHQAYYRTTGTYDLTGDGFVFDIGTMVATGVVATITLDIYLDASNVFRWQQVSNAVTSRKIVAGVDTQLSTATWSSSTYKYLRIREASGTIYFDSSTNGTSWTNRSSIVGLPFAITDLTIQFGAFCGNVASPGSLKLDDVNLILPALSTNWHMTQVEWPLLYRFRSISIATAAAATGQGYIATSNDGTTWAYYSGPLGSASGGYNSLTLSSSQANAQAMAVNLPVDGRWDLPSIVECRFIRLHHRSITGSSYTLRECYARRLTQSDDVEAESIRAINIAAASITADRLFVLQLSAITANIGGLNIDTNGYLWQGSGTAAAPTTGLKIYNSSGIGKLSTYNATVEQITIDTDGKLKWAAGTGIMDANGVTILTGSSYAAAQAFRIAKADTTYFGGLGGAYNTGTQHSVDLRSSSITGEASNLGLYAQAPSGKLATVFVQVQSGITNFAAISASTDNTTNAVVIDAVNSNGTITLGSPTTLNYNLNIATYVEQPETGQPATPAANKLREWVTDDGAGNTGVFWVDSTGTPMGFTCATTAGATAGSNGAPPAQVSGYLIVFMGGARRKIPYYNI